MKHLSIFALCVLIGALSGLKPAVATELVMLEQRGCVWCERWHAEIGAAYPNTAEGKIAPLRPVDIDEPLPDDLSFLTIERFTPTFVLVYEGREIGRIRGYGGNEFFWFLLSEMIDKLPDGHQDS